jgi:hypothetical protein
MEKYKSGECSICTEYFSLLHWHHTVPQAIGGENSLQIPLCSDCHNVLHANADAIVAKIRSGKPITRRFWKKPENAERAGPYLGILVNAILDPPLSGEDKGYKLQVAVPGNWHSALKILKQDLEGVTSLSDTILYCIAETLGNRGLINDNQEKHRVEDNRVPKKSKTDLW